jgi:hypothetical protein
MVLMVVIALVWRNDATHHQSDQAQQKAALRDALCIFHDYSSVAVRPD